MSKSIGNTILLSDEPVDIQKKMRTAVTDPQKIRKNDPGRQEICLVFSYHKKFNPSAVEDIEKGCRSGALGCVECKLRAATAISSVLAPLRERRTRLDAHPQEVLDVLEDGERRARERASSTMAEVRSVMHLG